VGGRRKERQTSGREKGETHLREGERRDTPQGGRKERHTSDSDFFTKYLPQKEHELYANVFTKQYVPEEGVWELKSDRRSLPTTGAILSALDKTPLYYKEHGREGAQRLSGPTLSLV